MTVQKTFVLAFLETSCLATPSGPVSSRGRRAEAVCTVIARMSVQKNRGIFLRKKGAAENAAWHRWTTSLQTPGSRDVASPCETEGWAFCFGFAGSLRKLWFIQFCCISFQGGLLGRPSATGEHAVCKCSSRHFTHLTTARRLATHAFCNDSPWTRRCMAPSPAPKARRTHEPECTIRLGNVNDHCQRLLHQFLVTTMVNGVKEPEAT